jgi:hypothetical protein
VEHDDRQGSGEDGGQRGQAADGQGIDEPGLSAPVGDLDQREALGIVVQAVGLGVDGDLADLLQAAGELDEVGLGANPAGDGSQRFRARTACSSRWERRRSGSSPSSCVMT